MIFTDVVLKLDEKALLTVITFSNQSVLETFDQIKLNKFEIVDFINLNNGKIIKRPFY